MTIVGAVIHGVFMGWTDDGSLDAQYKFEDWLRNNSTENDRDVFVADMKGGMLTINQLYGFCRQLIVPVCRGVVESDPAWNFCQKATACCVKIEAIEL